MLKLNSFNKCCDMIKIKIKAANLQLLVNTMKLQLFIYGEDHFPTPSPILSFSLPEVLCDLTLIWRKGIPFEAMTGHTAPSSDGLLAEVFWGFPQL